MVETAETKPQIVSLQEDTLFIGPDGIALTELGSLIHKLLHDQSFLSQVESRNGTSGVTPERRSSLVEERDQMCRDLGFDPMMLKEVRGQFFSLVEKRMPTLDGFDLGFKSNPAEAGHMSRFIRNIRGAFPLWGLIFNGRKEK